MKFVTIILLQLVLAASYFSQGVGVLGKNISAIENKENGKPAWSITDQLKMNILAAIKQYVKKKLEALVSKLSLIQVNVPTTRTPTTLSSAPSTRPTLPPKPTTQISENNQSTTAKPFNSTVISCNITNDLVISIDESRSVGVHDFGIALSFAAELGYAWRQHPHTRVAVFLFSDDSRPWITLYNSTSYTPQEIKEKILEATGRYLGTRIDLAMEDARREFLTNNRTIGMSVPRNAVFLTDGASDPVLVEAAAERLYRVDNVRGFSVGVGNAVQPQQLLVIAGGEPSHIFNIADFDTLLDALRPVSQQICME